MHAKAKMKLTAATLLMGLTLFFPSLPALADDFDNINAYSRRIRLPIPFDSGG